MVDTVSKMIPAHSNELHLQSTTLAAVRSKVVKHNNRLSYTWLV